MKPTSDTYSPFSWGHLDNYRAPLTRATDPATSHQAEDYMRESGKLAAQQWFVLASVERTPGLTAREHDALHGAPASFHRRLVELERLGKVRRGEPRKCKQGNRQAATWWPIKQNGPD